MGVRPPVPEPDPPCFVPCPHCDGLGRVELSGVYLATLAILRGLDREANGAALAIQAGCTTTAMDNRFVYLERKGLAVGRRNGREQLWRAK